MSVFKRVQRGVESEAYSYKFYHQGQQILRKTPFTIKAEAEKAEAEHRKLLESGKFEQAATIRSRKAKADTTLAQIINTYTLSPVDANETTRKANVNNFKNVVRHVHGKDADFERLPASLINAELAASWFNQASREVLAEDSQTEQGSIRRSANSIMQQAKSLFVPRALEAYAEADLELPNVAEFLAKCKTRKFTKAIKTDYHAPKEEIIQQTLKDWQALQNRDLFLVIGHALAFGLRKGEITQVRWNWHTTRDTVPCLDATGDMKNGLGFLQVRALDPFYSLMMTTIKERKWEGKPADFIVNGTDTYRTEALFRNVSAWMRARGWETQKTVHEFRAYSGSQVAMRYGIYECSSWLRHSSVKVTEQAYTRFVKLFRPDDVTKLPAKWAAVPTVTPAVPFVPKVVQEAIA